MRRLAVAILLLPLTTCLPPAKGADALLHPTRRPVTASPALAHRDVEVDAGGVRLKGWLFPAATARRGTVVYLHGLADNRASGTWIAEKLVPRGFDVLAYDARAHGESGGAACTYGFHEKRDLSRVLDALGVERAVLVGVSMGAAIALQAAPDDPRVVGVVSVATFADLATRARERAPLATDGQLRKAARLAEREASFRIADVSPARAARRVRRPVLVLHGSADARTPADHSRRVYDALGADAGGRDGRSRLRILEGAGHDDALWKAWPDVEAFILEVSEAAAAAR